MKLTKLTLLRLILLFAGLGWGLTVIGAVLPWHWAIAHLEQFGGAGAIPDDPMLNYWLRMASGAFAIVGVFFLLAAWRPSQYRVILPVLAYCSLFEGVILLSYGLFLQLPLFPFGPDLLIAWLPGLSILWLQHSVPDSQPTTLP